MLQAIQDNVRCLRQGMELLQSLPVPEYTRAESACFDASVGEHMRHLIDHYACFVRDLPAGRIDYDARSRDRVVETDPAQAVARLNTLIEALEALGEKELKAPVEVVMDTGSEPGGWARSSVHRELQFLLGHTVHHYALIAVICRLRGIGTEPSFGVAPSTLRHRGQPPCAQ
ncbi:DinB family protein [Ruficoccus amylovorans]|uniref:DinB family protein n=1 Tax=Ruficoccus amylovorans TaxID=1804625 RepID=A0A842HEP5_9BACT|nr:DinB family protein [Ruficoccus amylovorans]MBC2594729.1 DinB family protein [Ruficoccus amylovorans]